MTLLAAQQRLLGSTTRCSRAHRTFAPAVGRRGAARPVPTPCRSQPQTTVVTDAAVPEGHKGLHGFLYGEGGAERHEAQGYQFRKVRAPSRAIFLLPVAARGVSNTARLLPRRARTMAPR